MSNIQCLIVDDEPLAIEVIKTHVARIPFLNVVGTCQNAIEAMEFLRREPIDLMFLDIQMPMLTGIEFLRSLTHRPKVIFTTAYRDYALESYELDVVDYLLKPISFERFFRSVQKVQSINPPSAPPPVPTSRPAYMDLNSNKKIYRVYLNEIRYIESLKDYIQVHLEDRSISTKMKISEIEKELPGDFLRIHRSYIVHTGAITAFSTYEVELGKHQLPIGSSYKIQVQEVLRGSREI